MHDGEVIARVLDGDVEAFAILVDRYHDECVRFASRMLRDRHDAEDALQETFLRAYRGLGRYQDRDLFRSWLYRILVNQCRTLAVRRQRERARFAPEEQGATSGVDSHERGVVLRDALAVLLAELDPLLREAFLLKHGEGLEYTEMAKITGASVPSLKMRVKDRKST